MIKQKLKLNIVFALFLFAIISSCKSNDDDPQYIDQIIDLYIKDSNNKDLLKDNSAGSYIAFSANDVQGLLDNSPVSFQKKMTVDSTFYLEYMAGAKRITLDSVSPTDRTYQSIITLNFTKKVNDTTNVPVVDEMKIIYKWTPSVFEVSKIYYNNILKFTKQNGQPNVVTIVK
jgi:hypothetical protein